MKQITIWRQYGHCKSKHKKNENCKWFRDFRSQTSSRKSSTEPDNRVPPDNKVLHVEDDGTFDDVELDQNPDQGVRAPIEVFQGFIVFWSSLFSIKLRY